MYGSNSKILLHIVTFYYIDPIRCIKRFKVFRDVLCFCSARRNLAVALSKDGKKDEVRELLRESLTVAKKKFPEGHPIIVHSNVHFILYLLGVCLDLLSDCTSLQLQSTSPFVWPRQETTKMPPIFSRSLCSCCMTTSQQAKSLQKVKTCC